MFEAAALLRSQNNHENMARRVCETYGRCHLMLLKAAAQVQKYLSSSKDIFHGSSLLQLSHILNQVGRVPFASLPMQHLINKKIEEINNQYRSILYVDWKDTNVYKDGISNEAVSFWSSVLEYRKLLGNSTYHNLSTYALACLTMPTSNAVVERMFSHITGVKTKSPNKMNSSMLETIVRICTHLYFRGKCLQGLCAKQKNA